MAIPGKVGEVRPPRGAANCYRRCATGVTWPVNRDVGQQSSPECISLMQGFEKTRLAKGEDEKWRESFMGKRGAFEHPSLKLALRPFPTARLAGADPTSVWSRSICRIDPRVDQDEVLRHAASLAD
jgi:hypothetical protein